MTQESAVFYTRNPQETEILGERIGRALQEGSVVALIGELGAGKTMITKGIAKGLGVTALIHSPTFTLIHEHVGRLPIYHFDLYRLDKSEDLEDIGAESYFYGHGVSIVEWAEKAGDHLPPDRLEIRITWNDHVRTFEITATGPRSVEILENIKS